MATMAKATDAKAILRQVRREARNGFFAWPGGYQEAAIMADGECLCVKCVRENYRSISEATRRGDRSGWEVAGVDVLWEGPAEVCAHCGEAIPTAYGDDEN